MARYRAKVTLLGPVSGEQFTIYYEANQGQFILCSGAHGTPHCQVATSISPWPLSTFAFTEGATMVDHRYDLRVAEDLSD